MSGENKKTPSPDEKNTSFEKGAGTDLGETKAPELKNTPPPAESSKVESVPTDTKQ